MVSGGDPNGLPQRLRAYGPHQFVVRCVADDLARPAWELHKSLLAIPRRGNGNLLRDIRNNPSRFASDGRPAFAVFDGDQLPELLSRPRGTCRTALKADLLKDCAWAGQLHVVILERNLESLLRAVLQCAPEAADERTRALALDRKSLAERDVILNRVAREARRNVRDCVRQAMPSFDYLIRKLVEACRG